MKRRTVTVSVKETLPWLCLSHALTPITLNGWRHWTLTCPCIANIFSQYNQQPATFQNLFISVRRSTCFRLFFRPSLRAQNCTYSVSHLYIMKRPVLCFFMYVPCILYIVYFIRNAQFIVSILTALVSQSVLHVSIHLYHPQAVPQLYIAKVMYYVCY